jgi:hypothetical protein
MGFGNGGQMGLLLLSHYNIHKIYNKINAIKIKEIK